MPLPPGAGFPLKQDEQLLVQLHLLNSSEVDVDASTYVNFTFAKDASSVTPAGIWAWGNFDVDIPAKTKGYRLQSECMLEKKLNIFGFFPHMHNLGRSLQLEVGDRAESAKVIYKRDPWVFGDQRIDEMPLTLELGAFTRMSCLFDNDLDHNVKFGESSNNEMCILTVFYTPFERLDGCIVGDYIP